MAGKAVAKLKRVWIDRDEEDYRFLKAFSVEELRQGVEGEARQFFEEHGFVVVRNVLSEEECQRTRDAIFESIEKETPGFKRDDPSTWPLWNSKSYGISGNEPVFAAQFLHNRQNENLYHALRAVMGLDDRPEQTDDVILNHDRWCFYRPTKEAEHLKTPSNLHLDLDPWKYYTNDPEVWSKVDALRYNVPRDFISENNQVLGNRGRQVQVVLNLFDNLEEDGGFQIIPGFHRVFNDWVQENRSILDPRAAGIKEGGLRCHFFEAPEYQALSIRVPCAAGSMIVWDQRCAHGSRPNKSMNPRAAMFLSAFTSRDIPPERARARAEALRREFLKTGHGFEDGTAITAVGRRVFGLDLVR